MELVDSVAAAARTFLDGLDDEHASDALLPFDKEERRVWAYWPTERRGIPLWRLDRGQTKVAHRLVASLLAVPAYARVVTIMRLDEVLDRMEGYGSDRRHGDDYWISILLPPGGEVWGMRFEGHQISVHATSGHGEARLTPLFFGANPAVVHDVGLPAVAPLGPEEQLGFELLHALSAEERSAVVVSDEAPDDILTRNQARIDRTVSRQGVPLSALRSAAAASAYGGVMPDRVDWAEMVAAAVCRRAGCSPERRATVAAVVLLAAELAREGREGRGVGTLITIGDTDTVLRRSRALILDPLAGHDPAARHVGDRRFRET